MRFSTQKRPVTAGVHAQAPIAKTAGFIKPGPSEARFLPDSQTYSPAMGQEDGCNEAAFNLETAVGPVRIGCQGVGWQGADAAGY
jgi:hypothetical protein